MKTALGSEIQLHIDACGRWGYSVRVVEVLDCWLDWVVYDGAAWTLRGAQRRAKRHLRRCLRLEVARRGDPS